MIMDILAILKYILPLTIVFDASVALFLIRNSFHDKTTRIFLIALIAFVFWEIPFWLGFFANYGTIVNNIVDRCGFIFGLSAQYFLFVFLVQYSKVKFSKRIFHIITVLAIILIGLIAILGIGERQYIGIETYNYLYGYDSFSWLLGAYYGISILVTLLSLYVLYFFICPGLSKLEVARRRLMKCSIIIALFVTIAPTIVVPFIAVTNQDNYLYILADKWYITLSTFGAICSSVWTITTAYAITRYRLFDVTVKIRRSLLLLACAIGLGLVLFGANQLLFSPYLDNLEQSVAIAVLTVAASLAMILCTRKFGMGDPISFALTEPVAVDTTVKELAQKLQHYLQTEFELTVDGIYLLDPKNHNFFDVKTGMALTAIPEAMLKNLQMELLVQEHLPTQLKSSTALLAIVNGDFLLGFVAISTLQRNLLLSPVKQGIITASKYFAQLFYQAMFSSYIYAAAATKQA